MKDARKYTARGIALASVGMLVAFVGGIFSFGVVSADTGVKSSSDLGLMLVIGGAVLVVSAIITIAVVYFAD
jgi:hypothetical protein